MADIILKNANGTPQAYNGVTKIKVPTADGGTATFSEGSGGGGIEEVTELPVASAENVGKIYRYEGMLYECKEIIDLCLRSSGNVVFSAWFDDALQQDINITYLIVDSEPNIEDMELIDMETMRLPVYILKDGTNGWLAGDTGEELMKMTLLDMFGFELGGSCESYNIPGDNNQVYLVHYYDNEPIDSTYTSSLLNLSAFPTTLILPKRVHSIRLYAFALASFKNVIFNGDVFSMGDYCFQLCSPLQSVDLSNTTVVTKLGTDVFNNCMNLTEIKVPQALLNDFKTATNWSEYADKIVGV